jgi:rubrerythrin
MLGDPQVIRVLNQLLVAEQRSLVLRLTQSTPYISWASADELDVIQQMIREEAEHVGWVSEQIVALGTAPEPVLEAIDSGDIHYVELSFIWPRIVKSKRELLAAYEAALGELPADHEATGVVRRIRDRYREHISQLERFAESMSSS